MKVLVAGDFCPRGRVAAAFEKEDYASVLDSARILTSQADYSIVNLECPVVTDIAKPIKKVGPNLRSSSQGLNAIQYAGFDCVTLANNHFRDYGDIGVIESLEALKRKKIDYVGGGESLTDASRLLFKDIDGKRLAVVNCCEHEFSIASNMTAGSNPLNPIQQYYQIKDACKQADHVIVIVHGGHEHWQLPSPRMVETYRFFIDAGADAVLNHHQHCFSGYEVYNNRPIFYGLGNFCFDHPKKHSGTWTEGYAVMLDLSSTDPKFTLYPYRQCADEAKVELLNQDAYDNRIKELNAIITNPKKLEKEKEIFFTEGFGKYSALLEPIRNKYYSYLKQKGILPSFISKERKLVATDFICCEAHRDRLMFYLDSDC